MRCLKVGGRVQRTVLVSTCADEHAPTLNQRYFASA